MSETQPLPMLYKRTTGGKIQTWRTWTTENPDGTATIHTEYGLEGGKLQHQEDVVTSGKNVDRSNATTPIAQAQAEAKSNWMKRRDRKHYGLTATESATKRDAAPMLAQVFADRQAHVDWLSSYGQPKLDGFRCLARCGTDGVVRLESREGKPIETMPHIVEQLATAMEFGDTWDGELYVPGMAFQDIAKRVKKLRTESAEVQYHVYDLQSHAQFSTRYDVVAKTLRRHGLPGVLPVKTVRIPTLEELMAFQASCVDDGYEGAMLRHGKVDYEAGKRSKYLLKVKTFVDAEFPIVAVREGRGTHAGMAIFTCLTPSCAEFEVTAPGTHQEKRAAWEQATQLVGRKLTVKFFEYTTTEQPVPRFPVAIRIHESA